MNQIFNTSNLSFNGNTFLSCLLVACFFTFSQLSFAQSVDITYEVSEVPEQYIDSDIPLCDKIFYNFTATPSGFPNAVSYEYDWGGGALIQDDDEQVALVGFFGSGPSFIEVTVIGYDANGNIVGEEDESLFVNVLSNSDITFDLQGGNTVCGNGTLAVKVSIFERNGNGGSVSGEFQVMPEEAGSLVETTSIVQQSQNSQGINYTVDGLFTPNPDFTGTAVLIYVFERGNGCQKSGASEVEVYAPIAAAITTNDNSSIQESVADVCSDGSLALFGKPTGANSDEDEFLHDWSVSDALNGTSVNPANVLDDPSSRTPIFTPPADAIDGTIYQLVYTANDVDHAEEQCPQNTSAPIEITVRKAPSSASIDASPTTSCVSGSDVELSFGVVQQAINSPRTYTIEYTDGTNTFTETDYNTGDAIIVNPTENTTYSLVSVVDNFGCNVDDVSEEAVTVTVDTDAPVFIATESDQTIEMDGGVCIATIPNFVNANNVSDDCNVSIVQDPVAGSTFGGAHNDTQIITITATDDNGNAADYSFTLTLLDTQDPTFASNAPGSQNVIMESGACEGIVPNLIADENFHNDNCTGGMEYTQIPVAGSTFGGAHGDTQNISITIIDDGGNTDSYNLTLTLIDNQIPTTTLSDGDLDRNATTNTGVCYSQIPDLTTDFGTATSDNCNLTITQNPTAGTDFGSNDVRTQDVTVTATDDNGNSVSREFTITLIDDQAPVMSCTNQDQNREADPFACSTLITYQAPVATDNCELEMTFSVNDGPKMPVGVYQNQNYGNGEFFVGDNNQTTATLPVGIYDIKYFATDADDNETVCGFVVTILDTQNPSFSSFENSYTATTDTDDCGTDVEVIVPIGTDNCAVQSVSLDGTEYTQGSTYTANYDLGTTPLIWTVTDVNGNSFDREMDITVTDATAPILEQLVNIQGNTDDNTCASDESWASPTTTDACGINSITYSNDRDVNITTANGMVSGNFPLGLTNVTYTVEDVNGNETSKSFTVEILDDDAPVFTTVPDDIENEVTNDGDNDSFDCLGTASWAKPVFADNCDEDAFYTVSRNDGGAINTNNNNNDSGAFPVGTTTVTYVFEDNVGNTSIYSFEVMVTDNQAPRFSGFPGEQSVNVDEGACGAVVSFNAPNPNDNCTDIASSGFSVSDPTVILTEADGMLSGNFPTGTTVVTYTATDENGLAANRNFDVIVTDNLDPVVTPVAETFASSADNSNCTYEIPDLRNVVIIDEPCGVADFTQNPEAGTIVSGTDGNFIPVVVTVTDPSGNETTITQDVTLKDILGPVFTSTPTPASSYDSEGECTKSITLPLAEATDNCDGERNVDISFGTKTNTGAVVEPIGLSFNPQVLPDGNFVADYPVGTTVVTFTTEDTHGNVSETSIDVIVIGVDANFTAAAATHPFAPIGVQFTANYVEGTTYEWNFGNGLTGSGQSVLAGYGTPGDYTVTLTINGCFVHSRVISVPVVSNIVSIDNGINENAQSAELGYFYTQTEGKDVNVNWGMVNEIKDEVFVVQHSKDGVTFEAIEETPGNGNIVGDYGILHENAGEGKNFYRIQYSNNDGTFSFSDIATARVAAEAHEMAVYPNPSKDFVMVQVPETFLGQQVLIEVFDLQGNVVKSQRNADDLGTIRLDLSQLSAGNYVIRAVSDWKTTTKTIVIVD